MQQAEAAGERGGLAALPHLANNIKCVCFLAFEAQLKQCNIKYVCMRACVYECVRVCNYHWQCH